MLANDSMSRARREEKNEVYMWSDEVFSFTQIDGWDLNQSMVEAGMHILWMTIESDPEGRSSQFRYQKISTFDEEPEYTSGSKRIQLGRKIWIRQGSSNKK